MVEGPTTNRRFSRRQIRNAMIAGFALLIIVVIGGGGWTLYSKIASDSAKAEQQAREEMARNIASQIQSSLAKTVSQLSDLAKSEQTAALFENGDDESLSKTAEENQSLFEYGLKLRYLKPGAYELDNASVPPLSYGSLDMLKKAETR
ncbi:MAG: hypothetical protein MI865_11665, partial [Proteobacteria bacterium]|nr:hypothetical protein [Pseudomonadota bacterium]